MSAHEHDPHCLELAERISEFIDLELPPDLRAKVEAHLSSCANCVKFVDSLRRTRDLASLLPAPGLPPETLRRLGEAARRRIQES